MWDDTQDAVPPEPPRLRVGRWMSVTGNPVCASCPALSVCGDEAIVHTCKSCFAKACTPSLGSGDSVPIPDGCPIWGPVSGSAWDCSSCTKEREDVKRSHPSRVHGMIASGKMLKALLGNMTTKQGDQGASDAQDVFQEAAAEFVGHHMPFRHVKPTDAEFEVALVLARQLKALAMLEPEFQDEVARNETWDVSLCDFEWAEALVLARQRHAGRPDVVERVTREWVLVFDDRAPWCRAWTRMPVPRRVSLVRGWAAIFRTVFRPITVEG